ncbi:MAG TPA: hypothetical protein VF735_07210 [Pyrinomonadaceae bacterium]|jgi:hypothetical protein
MSSNHEVKIRTGRRTGDGRLRISVFADQLLALGVEGQGERAPTLLLTLEQAKELRDALAELIPLAEASEPEENMKAEAWQGTERRMAGK